MINVESTSGSEIVTAAEVKTAGNISGSSKDTLITNLIIAARRLCESKGGIAIVEKTVSEVYPSFASFNNSLNGSPVKAITSITYFDENNDSQTVTSSDYSLDKVNVPAKVNFISTFSAPDTYTRTDAVKVTYTVGLTRDEDIKLAEVVIKSLVIYWFDNPTDSVKKLPTWSEYLINSLREKFF